MSGILPAAMRVLVILAHKSNVRGKLLGDHFVKSVRAAFAGCINFQERLDIVVRTHAQLSDFLPPLAAHGDVPDMACVRDRLTCLDGVDFVFLDGDDNLLPWSRPAAPLLQLLHLCLTSNKMVFGSGCALQLLSYLINIGPVQVPVLNGGGRGGTLRSFSSGCSSVAADLGNQGVLLERQTGDLFCFDEMRHAWTPVGNVGLHCSLGVAGVSGEGAGLSTGINRSSGVGPCELTQLARFHFLFENVWPAKLIVPQCNEWHCHLPAFDAALHVPTGRFDVRVLAVSPLGTQVVECRNMIAVQFRLEERHPHTMTMLQNFVSAKVNLSIGEGEGELPARILHLAATSPQHSDVVQQILRSLAHTAISPSTAGGPLQSRDNAGRTAAHARARPPAPDSVRPPAARALASGHSRPSSAASAPAIGQRLRSLPNSTSASGLASTVPGRAARPDSARSDAPSAASTKPAGAGAGLRQAASGGYCLRPSAAYTYLVSSRNALDVHAQQVVCKPTPSLHSEHAARSASPLGSIRVRCLCFRSTWARRRRHSLRCPACSVMCRCSLQNRHVPRRQLPCVRRQQWLMLVDDPSRRRERAVQLPHAVI